MGKGNTWQVEEGCQVPNLVVIRKEEIRRSIGKSAR